MVKTILFCVLVGLTGCALPPTEQFLRYDSAFNEAKEASNSVLEVYNVYEKELYPLNPNVFDPNQAFLLSDSVNGPITSLYFRGFDAVERYNVILLRYAQGDSITSLQGDISAFNASTASLGSLVGAAQLAAKSTGAVTAATALARVALSASDTVEFERSLKEGGSKVSEFLIIVRQDTRDMYQDVSTAMLKRIQKQPSSSQREQANRLRFRDMLAAWVLLIDETLIELERLQAAIDVGQRSSLTLSNASASINRITQYAEDIRFAKREIEGLF